MVWPIMVWSIKEPRIFCASHCAQIIVGAKLRRVNALRAKLTFNPPPNRLAGSQQSMSASQGQKCLVNVCPLFAAHAQSPELVQPCEGPFHNPAPSPQSAGMLGVALCKKRDDASITQT